MTQVSEYRHPLIAYLIENRDERAMLAALRRGLGQPLGAVPDMFPYVVRFLPEDASRWDEECLYLMASLFALHPAHTAEGNLGDHLYQLAIKMGDSQATERRFQQLLRAEPEMLPDLLRQIISLLKTNEIPVNWHQLMRDIYSWYWPDRRRNVVRWWARSFWK